MEKIKSLMITKIYITNLSIKFAKGVIIKKNRKIK